MIEYENLTFIGTSHISPESIRLVQRIIQEKKPEFVALELDRGRFAGLMAKKKERRRLSFKEFRKFGLSGFVFALIGAWVEGKMGKMVGTTPGGEMKAAVHEAAKAGAKILLIDQEISITIKRLFKALTWREKSRFVIDIVKGVFGYGEVAHFDLKEVPEDSLIEHLIGQVKERYPSVYRTLIEERNVYMAKKLAVSLKKHPDARIVVVIGAGHEKAILELITRSIRA
ncbi:TraB/GumN family protein [Candidatus Woesearchaeota archaeon]|nr:TraB/GumN family protein [Candidatus Woesearchaeota archaeon]